MKKDSPANLIKKFQKISYWDFSNISAKANIYSWVSKKITRWKSKKDSMSNYNQPWKMAITSLENFMRLMKIKAD